MSVAPLPANETQRLAALERYGILDTLPEAEYDDLTLLASQICQTPISLISLVDRDRQWFKSRWGVEVGETPREVSFCAHAIHGDELFEVCDASIDARFHENVFVTGAPHIRFYAGAPLITGDGLRLGTLCVVDQQPRELCPSQRQALQALARQVMTQLELRRAVNQLQQAARERRAAYEKLKARNRELHASREVFRRFMDNSPVAAFIKDRDGRFLYCNRMLEWTFNLKPRALLGRTDFDWLPAPVAQAVHDNDLLVMREGRTLQTLEKVPTPNNGECEWLVYKFPIGRGDERRLGGVALDLTELRRSEKLKNEFVSVVSHELRTPLTALRGSLGLLQNGVAGELPDAAHDMVALALKNAERLGMLIDDLLDIEKIESGAMRFEKAPLSLKHLLQGAVEVNAPYAASLGARLLLEMPEEWDDVRVEGDANRLMQVLANLLSNAAKYTAPKGKVWLRARCVEVDVAETDVQGTSVQGVGQTETRARIEVTDEGEGVPAEFVPRLFQRFAQADSQRHAAPGRNWAGAGDFARHHRKARHAHRLPTAPNHESGRDLLFRAEGGGAVKESVSPNATKRDAPAPRTRSAANWGAVPNGARAQRPQLWRVLILGALVMIVALGVLGVLAPAQLRAAERGQRLEPAHL